MEKKNPIEEARRYVSNAKEVIQKANYDSTLKMYTDGKYVKMAGNTLWNGCLVALDAALGIYKGKGKGRPSIEKYEEAAGKRDRKLLAAIEKRDIFEIRKYQISLTGRQKRRTHQCRQQH